MLGGTVGFSTRGRLESHGAGGAFIEDLTVSRLHVSLYSVQTVHSSKHQMTTGTSADKRK